MVIERGDKMKFYLVIALFIMLILNFGLIPGLIKAEEASKEGDIKKLVIPLRVSAIVSTTATAVIWSKYYVTNKDYMDAIEPNKISEYYDDANKYYKLRNGFVIATGILWVANLATLLINPPPEEADEFLSSSNWKIQRDAENRLSLNCRVRF